MTGALNEWGRISRLVVKHARDAFTSPAAIDAQWRSLAFTTPPVFGEALREYDAFLHVLSRTGAVVDCLPPAPDVGLDSIYVRDASIVCDRGLILCSMGKPERIGEPAAQSSAFADLDLPVVGAITPPGRLEGGDVVWLDDRTVAIGRGYRTNDEGIRQLQKLLGASVTVMVVPLPHWRGAGDVFHLMSIVSPVDRDLAIVYLPLMPVPFLEALLARGITLVDVPDEEFDSMGANVLAIAPRQCVMVAGNPISRARLERAGAEVIEYSGREISLKGGGGPTCLTRPVVRDDDLTPK